MARIDNHQSAIAASRKNVRARDWIFQPWSFSDGVAGGCTVASISGAHQLTPEGTRKQAPFGFIFCG
jgi:hypothetical protein